MASSLPTAVDQPVFPIPPGSALSQLLESANPKSGRCPSRFSGIMAPDENPVGSGKKAKTANPGSGRSPRFSGIIGADEKFPVAAVRKAKASPTSLKNSKIPRRSSPAGPCKFQKSLRNYSGSAPTSRAASPFQNVIVPSKSLSRPPSPSPLSPQPQGKTKIPSSSKPRTTKSSSNTPTKIPTTPRLVLPPRIHGGVADRPVRLAYGIYAPPPLTPRSLMSRNNSTDSDSNNNHSRNKSPRSCCSTIEKAGTSKTSTTTQRKSSPRKKSPQKSPHKRVTYAEIYSPRSTDPVKDGNKDRPSTPTHEATKKSWNASTRIVNMDPMKVELNKFRSPNYSAALERRAELEVLTDKYKATIDDLSYRNKVLELKLKEKLGHENSDTLKQDKGSLTDATLRESMKFPVEDFIFSQFKFNDINDLVDIFGGDAEAELSDNGNPDQQQMRSIQIALATREALLAEIRSKLKNGMKILQKRCDVFRESEDDVFPSKYQTVYPPEADFALHSYRRFVRFLEHYVDHSVKDIYEFDRKTLNMDLKTSIETDLVIDGVIRPGMFIPYIPGAPGEFLYNRRKFGDTPTKSAAKNNHNQQKQKESSKTQPSGDKGSKPEPECPPETDHSEVHESHEDERKADPNSSTTFTVDTIRPDEDTETESIKFWEDPLQSEVNRALYPEWKFCCRFKDHPEENLAMLIDWDKETDAEPIPEIPIEGKTSTISFLRSETSTCTCTTNEIEPEPVRKSPLQTAKDWLDTTPSSMTCFILDPVPIGRLLDPVNDPRSSTLILACEEIKRTNEATIRPSETSYISIHPHTQEEQAEVPLKSKRESQSLDSFHH